MAVKGTSLSQRFDNIKRDNPGISDSKAMEQAIAGGSKVVAGSSVKVAATKARKKGPNWAHKLKMGVTKQLAKRYHSKAGKKHKRKKKGY